MIEGLNEWLNPQASAFYLQPYLISLCTVTFLNTGLNFFNSNLSVVFLRFLVEIYLDIPGMPLSLCSVHSKIT